MSQQQKFPFPNFPLRYPFPFPQPANDKNKLAQPGTDPNSLINPIPSPHTMGGVPYIPQRMLPPYFGGYNMFPMPQPFPPYMPLNRNIPNGHSSPENSKSNKQIDQRMLTNRPFYGRPMPPFFNPAMYYPPPIAPQTTVPAKKELAPSIQKPKKKEQKKQTKLGHSSSSVTQILNNQQQAKQKTKEVKHADIKTYEPEEPKKKRKKDVILSQNANIRQTRQKKHSIERIMQIVMRDKPLRDRIIKIGKQYQASIPQSFINEYQYNLKIKLQKKESLMNRLVKNAVSIQK